MSAELNELAAKVEALSGPDRRVDCAIFATLHPDKFDGSAAMYARIDWTRNSADWMWLREIGMPAYTGSSDSAMTIAPAELTLNISADAAQALIFRDGDGVVGRGDATGGNPIDSAARAITAAALRSKATSQ